MFSPPDVSRKGTWTNIPSENYGQKVTLVGASNLKRASQFFNDKDTVFDNISVPGWTPTAENVNAMVTLVEDKASDSTGFVFDLLGNSSEGLSNLTALRPCPIRATEFSTWGGRVTPTPLGNFRKIIELVLPIFKAKGNKPCTIVPPLPRYLFSCWYKDSGHCTNMSEKDFPEKMLSVFFKFA